MIHDYDQAIGFCTGTLGFELAKTPGDDQRRATQTLGNGPGAQARAAAAAS